MVVGAKVCELTDGFLWFVCGLYVGILTSPLTKPIYLRIYVCKDEGRYWNHSTGPFLHILPRGETLIVRLKVHTGSVKGGGGWGGNDHTNGLYLDTARCQSINT